MPAQAPKWQGIRSTQRRQSVTESSYVLLQVIGDGALVVGFGKSGVDLDGAGAMGDGGVKFAPG